MFGAFFIGLAAAASNATSNVLQRGAHIDALSETNEKFSMRFLLGVMRRPRWLLGIITMIISFLLQAVGLAISSLSVIQPILVMELPLTLIGAGIFLKESLSNREWLGATLMFCGVLIFIIMLKPTPGTSLNAVTTPAGAGAMGVTIAIVFILYFASKKFGTRAKTAILGLASGVGFGITAAVIKDMTARIQHLGYFSIFSGWQLYLLIIFGVGSVFLYQQALATGRLMYAQPGVTLADPFVAVIWGIAVFNEDTRGGLYILLALIGVALTATGVMLLSRSRLLSKQ